MKCFNDPSHNDGGMMAILGHHRELLFYQCPECGFKYVADQSEKDTFANNLKWELLFSQ